MEEQEERERQKERAAIEEQLRQRLELQAAHHDYLDLKQQKEEAQRAEEKEFRQQVVLNTTYMSCYMCTSCIMCILYQTCTHACPTWCTVHMAFVQSTHAHTQPL